MEITKWNNINPSIVGDISYKTTAQKAKWVTLIDKSIEKLSEIKCDEIAIPELIVQVKRDT